MSKVTLGLRYWLQIFLLPIYLFSFLIPRDRHLWLFGSTFGNRFADSPRYFYLYCSQYHKLKQGQGIRAIWITKQKKIVTLLREHGYEAYYRYSIPGIWYCLRGKVYLFDNYSKDINFWLSGGAVKINLWHGIPLKKIQRDNCFDRVRNPRNWKEQWRYALRRMSDEKPSHYVLTTSEELIPIFSSAFGTKKVLTSGYPRNDILVSKQIHNLMTREEEQDLKKINLKIQKEDYKKIIFYMPTFRDSEEKFFQVVDMKQFSQYLKEHKYLLCVKLHPKSKLRKQFSDLEKPKEPVIVLQAEDDPYVFLAKGDLLVTDYSSIFFDYLCLDRPIVFFDYDKEEYLEHSRKFYFDYDEITPGDKAETFKELLGAMEEALEEKEKEVEQRKRNQLKQRIFGEKKNLASEQLYQDVLKILKVK